MIKITSTVDNLPFCTVQMILARISFTYCLKSINPPQSWMIPFRIPPGRPSVSDCGLYHIAEYIDYYINPLAKLHPQLYKGHI